ncbi:MAG TPA: VWA domain-containing protein [Vicinamibacterales bacterium]
MKPSWMVLPAALALLASSALIAQSRFRADVDLVSLAVTIAHDEGQPVTDLEQHDFEIYEDGQLQSVRYFARGAESGKEVPLRLALLFDTSGSMGQDIRLSRTSAIKFLNAMPHAEDMTLVEFDTEVRLSRYSQDDFARLVERIRGRKPFGFTALYDALGTYLAGASELDGRKVLIIYTDGGDTRSSMSWSETLGLLKASDVTIHSIGFLEHQSAAAQFAQKRQLQQIAEITGGRAFFPRDGKDVDLAYDSILAELEAQYVMGYISTNPRMDGRWRKVEIKVKRPELKRAQIRTRPGYFARRRETVP